MQQFKNYVMPTLVEAIAYCTVALLLLILDNGQMIIKNVTGLDSQDSTQLFSDLFSPLLNNIKKALDTINPSVLDAFLWLIIGVIVVMIAFWIAIAIEKLFAEKATLSNVSNKKLHQKEILTFLVRQGIRMTAFFVAISLFIYFVGELFSRFSASFYRAFENASIMNIVIAILCVPAVALAIYLMVVCVRFVLLRPRIF